MSKPSSCLPVTPIVLPSAYATGAERGATVGSVGDQRVVVDAISSHDPESEIYRSLWRAVIGQQISDAKNTSLKPEKQSLKRQAMDWLFNDESNFRMVCDLAGWEPDYVRSLCAMAGLHGLRHRTVCACKESHNPHSPIREAFHGKEKTA